jgi:hypothetical protein
VCGLVIYALWLRPRRKRVLQRPVGSTSSIHSDIGT